MGEEKERLLPLGYNLNAMIVVTLSSAVAGRGLRQPFGSPAPPLSFCIFSFSWLEEVRRGKSFPPTLAPSILVRLGSKRQGKNNPHRVSLVYT